MAMSRYHPFFSGGDWFDWPTPSRIFDQNFGMGMLDEMMDYPMTSPMVPPRIPYWMRPRQISRGPETGLSEVENTKEKFQVSLDVSHFKPEEITVTTVDNTVVVKGHHEEKMDEHGFVSRSFTRKYMLPKDVEPESVVSKLTHEGVLQVLAPKKAIEAPGERKVKIEVAPAPAKPAVEHAKKVNR